MNPPFGDIIIIYVVLKTLLLKGTAFSCIFGVKLSGGYEKVEWRSV